MHYYSPSVKQNKSTKGKPWRATVYYKDPSDGKVHQKTKVLRLAKGKKEAQQMAREWCDELNEYAKDLPTPEKGETIAQVIQAYEDYKLLSGLIEKSTYKRDLLVTSNYINPYLGDYDYRSLERIDINRWLTDLYSKHSATTVRNAYTQLKKVYTYLCDTDQLEKNPFNGVKAPKGGKPKATHLTKDQMDKFLLALSKAYEPTDPLYSGFLLAYYGGLRRGEICGLRWRNVDFNKETITIDSSVGYGAGGNYTKPPKTISSYRNFPMLPQLKEALKVRYDYIKPNNNWFVIGSRDKFMSLQAFSSSFSKFVKDYDLKDYYGNPITPHGLRHNLATVGINSGMDIASLSLMMGHASRAMTLDIYGDANADALKMATEKLSNQFNNDKSKEDSEEKTDEKYTIELTLTDRNIE